MGEEHDINTAFIGTKTKKGEHVTICSRVKIMSLLIYKILNYEGLIKTRMTIDHELILNDQFFMITTMAASVLELSHKTA